MQEIHALKKFSRSNKSQFKSNKKSTVSPNAIDDRKLCFACGKGDHNFATCKYKSYTCMNCNRVGHLPRVCSFHKQKKKNYHNNFIDDESTCDQQSESEPSDSDSDSEHYLYNLNNEKTNPFVLQLTVNDAVVDFEVDTGASLSVCSRAFYEKNWSILPIKKSNIILNSYNKSIIKPIGAVEIAFTYNNKRIKSDILIIENGGKPLIGRDILKKMKIDKVCELNVNPLFDQMVKKHKEIFSENLGCYKYEKIKMEIKKDTKPIFVKPRRVPISMQNKVDREINRLISIGVIRPIKTSDWGTPIVPILKNNGEIRICADYSTTINPHLIDNKYVLPNIDDIFAALCGGQFFTKLDLRSAYNNLNCVVIVNYCWRGARTKECLHAIVYRSGQKQLVRFFSQLFRRCFKVVLDA